ncbi:hypothetical protein IFM61392_02289 [Aspergillus lentulus]|uniref:Uncharacterized protein n=1 Tax=Aspergillus lentulus TaxID=293939 RepID=A0AAN5YYV7_ASPLE|nr:hypothetical protein CNMCM6069_007540 [Aspergillus lentulus]KAF4173018.1 hypothetical protein CNMCM8060_000694 [Aspergillus lentulus]KAF4184977.1 hypothetical protein CNMCM7927_007238 [Aspergillus lentulus]KAF4198321.1 hypothetical protein CNMCM8694_000439 [Aspergillus lentulus]KAF4210011.1 hypothetical protein CNMCM8927_003276 [Aspergillus lentulus]
MALRLPPQVTRRRNSYSTQQVPELDIPSPVSQLFENESAQWVLFSPPQTSTARTHTTSTERTPRTTGASRLSDFGSFGTATRSILGFEADDTNSDVEEPLDEDGTELDSLDDGLHAFRAPSVTQESTSRLNQSTPAVLPAHDGLGSFHASSQPVQEQLWQHEQFNPRRRGDVRLRRRSSVQRQLDSIEDREQVDMEHDRWQRIEKWRMDQSRALLQEIERETRRRRRNSRVSVQTDQVASQPIVSDTPDGVLETPKEDPLQQQQESEQDESFWRRITRKVIRDLIGIDDSLLSVIFGESLPDMGSEYNESAGTDNALNLSETLRELDSMPDEQGLWHSKLLQRIARELGILVHHLCEHPGAFTTYLNVTNEIPNEYAGIPLGRLAEENDAAPQSASAEPALHIVMSGEDSIMSPQFSPTMHDPAGREHAAHWGIEDEEDANREPLPESERLQQEKEYWERELDVMMVFRYLRNRFGRRGSNADSTHASSRRYTQDASRRAAIIRQHHPLVARAHSRSQAQLRRQSGSTGITSPLLRQQLHRPSSSCASQTKLSALSSRRTLTSSSRNYWDIGGSIDSASAIAPPVAAGVGLWGDV